MTAFRFIKNIMQAAVRLKLRRAGVHLGNNIHISIKGQIITANDAHISIGDNAWLLANYRLEAHNEASISIGARVHLGDRVQLVAFEGASIRIDNDCWFNHDVSIVARSNIVIGSDCLFGPYCYLSDHNHGIARNQLIRLQNYAIDSLMIGCDVWLGLGVTLLKGTKLGDGAVIAARSLVNKPVPENEVWGGVPARRLAERQ